LSSFGFHRPSFPAFSPLPYALCQFAATIIQNWAIFHLICTDLYRIHSCGSFCASLAVVRVFLAVSSACSTVAFASAWEASVSALRQIYDAVLIIWNYFDSVKQVALWFFPMPTY
jgi:hypothetical protein